MAEPQEGPEKGEPRRSHGVSPVVERRPRSTLSLIAGAAVILLVVGFLFVSSAKNSKPRPAPKAPAIASSPGLPPAAPAPPPLPPLSPDEAAAGFPPPPVPGQGSSPKGEAAESARQKEEARLHSPMLIYDGSGHEAPPPVKPGPADPLAALLANQLQNANSAQKGDEPNGRPSPAEGYAERTRAFAKTASGPGPETATAHRISMDDRIAEGKMLAATLETAIDSDLPGRLRAVVTSDVWSEDGSRRLIRKGSRLIGDYRSGLVRGQTRVFVIWTRLLQPDGNDVAIGSPGTDDLGRAGLTGTVDRHFAERFGAAFLLSLIGSATTASQGGNTFVVNTSQGFGQVAQESLQDSINIPPTITIDQGAPVQVFVARDLVFGQDEAGR